ncbi:DNA polymerase III subunit gamma/tau [Thermithiobacillus plumbiphilus]|uniref:DNA polymerase III subunit gamma/tau n=1 Tax=Thermithiobacillus plumbiphilus TaxID=1729899 RepID=A0ABU9DDS3_9PROT
MPAYLALARKWRPQRFADYVGQEHVVRALAHALDSGRLHHAFLFSGTRGVGKTTIARLFAKCLNCERGVSSQPCGECAACREIEEGRFVDLIEVDAASRTKVDDTRELLDNVQYAPTAGRFKVYLIDEVHMLSGHSFNALLKTLEEPPPHVKFLLATTDPQKLPVTVLSRCLQFNLRRLDPELIRTRMAQILEAEALAFDDAGLRQLARAADGSLRDALSLLDQAIVHGGGAVQGDAVGAMLGQTQRAALFDIVEALAAGQTGALFEQLEGILQSGYDAALFLEDLARILHALALRQVLADAPADDLAEAQRLTDLARRLNPADLQLYYQIALLARRDLHLAPDGRVGLEMALLRMLAFQPQVSRDEIAAPAPRPRQDVPARTASPSPSGKPFEAVTPVSAAVPAVRENPAPFPDPRVAASPAPATTAAAPGPADWGQVLQQLDILGLWKAVLEHAEAREFSAEAVTIALSPGHANMADNPKFRAALEQALKSHLGQQPKLKLIRMESAQGDTPARRQAQARQARQAAAEQAMQEDPLVREMLQTFEASIVKVEPKD